MDKTKNSKVCTIKIILDSNVGVVISLNYLKDKGSDYIIELRGNGKS